MTFVLSKLQHNKFNGPPHHTKIPLINRYISICHHLNKEYKAPNDPTNRIRDTMIKIIREETFWTRKKSQRNDTEIIDKIINMTNYCFAHSEDCPRLRRCVEKAEQEIKYIENPQVKRWMRDTLIKSRNVR